MTTSLPDHVPAPDLREVAETWWDVARDPIVVWDRSATRFELADPGDLDNRLGLAELAAPVADPRELAGVLAEGLAACDFPPTGTTAARGRVEATLRAHGRHELLA